MIKLNDILVFVDKAKLEKFDSEADALIVFKIFANDDLLAQHRTETDCNRFAVKNDFFVTDVRGYAGCNHSQTDKNKHDVKKRRINQRLVLQGVRHSDQVVKRALRLAKTVKKFIGAQKKQ